MTIRRRCGGLPFLLLESRALVKSGLGHDSDSTLPVLLPTLCLALLDHVRRLLGLAVLRKCISKAASSGKVLRNYDMTAMATMINGLRRHSKERLANVQITEGHGNLTGCPKPSRNLATISGVDSCAIHSTTT